MELMEISAQRSDLSINATNELYDQNPFFFPFNGFISFAGAEKKNQCQLRLCGRLTEWPSDF